MRRLAAPTLSSVVVAPNVLGRFSPYIAFWGALYQIRNITQYSKLSNSTSKQAGVAIIIKQPKKENIKEINRISGGATGVITSQANPLAIYQ